MRRERAEELRPAQYDKLSAYVRAADSHEGKPVTREGSTPEIQAQGMKTSIISRGSCIFCVVKPNPAGPMRRLTP